ncbi:uracil-DNA glycosylase family protein [Jannaschia marina]|uniref:uracil-DNA glycosylase family protein n=1 Tax=Jannaschia marina TaxID=2741674 RepID=UPI0015C9848A|nr:uracil-DNA glycosylase family protein [Jannaschia marina]
MSLPEDLAACRLCADRFAATATAHAPRPIPWFRPGAPIVIASQAPGQRAHASGVLFDDPSGRRLRDWMDLDAATFWNRDAVAVVPMAFCFPGYDAQGGDLPPPPVCARTWRRAVLDHIGAPRALLLVGGAAQGWHLGRGRVSDRVRDWRDHAPGVFCLPHPSWRNTAWLKRNPWFEAETLPALRTAIRAALPDRPKPTTADDAA